VGVRHYQYCNRGGVGPYAGRGFFVVVFVVRSEQVYSFPNGVLNETLVKEAE
jgi:hypothetical protein